MTPVLIDARLAIRGLGIATYIERLLQALHAIGVSTHLWKGSGEWGTSARLTTLTRSGLFDLSPRLDPRARSFDVVHFASNMASVVPGRNSVVTVHDVFHRRVDRTGLRGRLVGTVLERSLPRAGRVVASSARTRCELERVVPPLTGKVELILPGMRRLPPTNDPRRHILAFGGATDPRKRTDLMVAVYREYRATTPDALPLVVLARAGVTAPQRRALGAAGARIVPSATRDEVDALMATAAALLYPTSEEGVGLPILEAAEAGTPVVMDRDAKVATEVVGRHCFGVTGSSLDAWVSELRRAVANGPVTDALDLPDWGAVAGRYRSLYAAVSDR